VSRKLKDDNEKEIMHAGLSSCYEILLLTQNGRYFPTNNKFLNSEPLACADWCHVMSQHSQQEARFDAIQQQYQYQYSCKKLIYCKRQTVNNYTLPTDIAVTSFISGWITMTRNIYEAKISEQ
jgi:hypothetical protein